MVVVAAPALVLEALRHVGWGVPAGFGAVTRGRAFKATIDLDKHGSLSYMRSP